MSARVYPPTVQVTANQDKARIKFCCHFCDPQPLRPACAKLTRKPIRVDCSPFVTVREVTVREEELCTRIEAWLKQKGIAVQREVVCGNGIRADLVTPDTVIEVKKYLNRGNLYQAHGQGTTYQKLLNKPKLMIIGLAPISDAKYREAQRIAENIRSKTVEVIFLDKDPRWAVAVKLPFEQRLAPRLEQRTKAEQSKATRATQSSVKPAVPTSLERVPLLNIRNIGALLLSLLIFFWLRAILWKQPPPVIQQMQPNPEPTPEWSVPSSPLP